MSDAADIAAVADAVRLAPAKVNLALHVVGRRADGYHLLDGVVVFAATAGDHLAVQSAAARANGDLVDLVITAPDAVRAQLGPAGDNLAVRAAHRLAEAAGRPVSPVTLRLDKRLPVAAGLGGGSSDAAAALYLLNAHWRLGMSPAALAEIGLGLGADVPMCLAGTPVRSGGIGEVLTPLPALPNVALLLVNPGLPVATPAVFRRLARRDNPPLPPLPTAWRTAADLFAWLRLTRNDLAEAAIAEATAIGDVLAALAATGPGHHGMSGSGATCFALYATPAAAARAVDKLPPHWWRALTSLT